MHALEQVIRPIYEYISITIHMHILHNIAYEYAKPHLTKKQNEENLHSHIPTFASRDFFLGYFFLSPEMTDHLN